MVIYIHMLSIRWTSVVLFIVLFCMIQWFSPPLFYNKHGHIRGFGLGYENKTMCPIWLMTLILAMFCYMIICIIYNTHLVGGGGAMG
jgi:hypothetical protein